MIVGPGLCAFAMLCFLLTGPVGPCGPSSPLGLPLMLAGFVTAILGWVISSVALASAGLRERRSGVGAAALVASGASGALALAVAFTMAEGPEALSTAGAAAAFVWPPLAAGSHAISKWLQQRARSRVVTPG